MLTRHSRCPNGVSFTSRVSISSSPSRDVTQLQMVESVASYWRRDWDRCCNARQPSRRERLGYGQKWELDYPGSAADAYRAVLTLSFAPGAQRYATADSAVIGLVRIQSRNRLRVGDVPEAVDREWTPVREIRAF